MAIINDSTGLFNDVNYVDPNALPPDNGLDPTTGWARGVIEDANSPSGYSYNGVPVNTDGSRYESHQDIHNYNYENNIPYSPTPGINPETGSTNPNVHLVHDPTGRSYLEDQYGNISYDGSTWSNEPGFDANANAFGSAQPSYPLAPSTPAPPDTSGPGGFLDPYGSSAPAVTPDTTPGEFYTAPYVPQEGQPSYSDISQFMNTPLDNVSGSIFDRMGLSEPPTPKDLQAMSEPPPPPTQADLKRAADIAGRTDQAPMYGPGGVFMGFGTKNEGSQFGRFLDTAVQAPGALQQYVGGPIAQRTAKMLNNEDQPNLLTHPKQAYEEAFQANQDYLSNDKTPWWVKSFYSGVTDPLTYAGAAGLDTIGKNIAENAGKGIGGFLTKQAGGLIEQGKPLNILAANLGAGAAGEYGKDIPVFNKQPEILQQLEGGVLGFAAPGAATGGAKLLLKAGEGAHNGLVKLDQMINEPVGGQLVTAPQEFKTGLQSSIDQPRPFQFHIPEGEGAANKVTWLHSTTNPEFKLPDTEKGIYGITQGPGVYLASDPNYGQLYGNRAFAVEFDGNAMELGDRANPREWNQIKDTVKTAMLGMDNLPVRGQEVVDKMLDDAFSDYKLGFNTIDPKSNYAYRDALVNTVEALLNHFKYADPTEALGQFRTMMDKNYDVFGSKTSSFAKGIVQNALGENGIDGLVHRGRADGDVLIVINGDKARVTAELDRGHPHIKDGDTVHDVFKSITGARDVPKVRLTEANADTLVNIANRVSRQGEEPAVNAHLVSDNRGEPVGFIVEHQLPNGDSGFTVRDVTGLKVGNGYFPTMGEASNFARDQLLESLPQGGFTSMLNGDTGAATARYAAQTGLGAAAGAGAAELTGEDWKKGAAIGAGLALGAPLAFEAAGKLHDIAGIGEKAGGETGPVTRGMTAPEPPEGGIPKNRQRPPQDFNRSLMEAILPSVNKERAAMGGAPLTLDELIKNFSHLNPSDAEPPKPLKPLSEIKEKYDAMRNPEASDLKLEIQGASTPTFKEKLTKNILGVLGIPLETLVGGDLSAGGRQARPLGYSHPVLWAKALVKGIQAMDPVKNAQLAAEMIKDPAFRILTKTGNLHIAFLEGEEQLGTGLAGRASEAVSRKIKETVPGKAGSFLAAPAEYLPASERNYNMTLDYLRYAVGKQLLENAQKRADSLGKDLTKEEINSITNYINHKTGYGTGLSWTHGALSVPFLAPRYWLSKYQSVGDTFTKFATTPSLRGEIAKNTAVMLGTFAAVSELSAYLGGEAGIFENPLAGAFGSVGPKDFGFDVTGGLSTEIRNIGRIATGSRVDAAGKEVDVDRASGLGKFLRGKLSPNAGTLYSLITGEDYNGNPANLKSLEGLTNVAKGSVIPLFYQDVYKAFQKEFPGITPDRDGFDKLIQDIKDHPERLGMALLGSAGSAFGVPPYVQQESPYDERDKKLQELYPDQKGITWGTADKTQKNKYNEVYGKIPSTNPAALHSEDVRAQQYTDNFMRQSKIDADFQPGAKWRDAYGKMQVAVAEQFKANEQNSPYGGPVSQAPLDVAVRQWGDKIDELTPYPGGTDWDAVEAWLAKNPDIAKYVDQYMADPNKSSSALTDRVKEYRADSKVIRDSGFWDIKTNIMDTIAKQTNVPGWTTGMDYNDYYNQTQASIINQLVQQGYNPAVAKKTADSLIEKLPYFKILNDAYDKILPQWAMNNPEALYDLAKWEFIRTPNKKEAQILQAIEPAMRAREAEKLPTAIR